MEKQKKYKGWIENEKDEEFKERLKKTDDFICPDCNSCLIHKSSADVKEFHDWYYRGKSPD